MSSTDEILQAYQAAFNSAASDNTAAKSIRFAVLDCETTGTDARRDTLVSIGAISVQDGQICLDDQFEALLKLTHNSASVLVHGITREEAEQNGIDEPEALLQLLDYLGSAVIVGHHIGFDIEVIDRSLQRHFGCNLRNRWLDTMTLTLHLDNDGALDRTEAANPSTGRLARSEPTLAAPQGDFSLDGLCRRFGIAPHDRHTASGDAFITAQIFIKLLRLAARSGRTTLGKLAQPWDIEH